MERIGLDVVQDFYIRQLIVAVRKAAPFLTKKTIREIVVKAISKSIESDDASAEVVSKIFDTSRAQLYRDRGKIDPDQYSVLQKLVDCLCPVYPKWLSALDILHKVAELDTKLSLGEVSRILDYYTGEGCFEQEDNQYRLSRWAVWVDEALSSRYNRLMEYAQDVTEGMVGFLREKPDHKFRVVRLYGTHEELEDFVAGLKRYIDGWFEAHKCEGSPKGPFYVIGITTSIRNRPAEEKKEEESQN